MQAGRDLDALVAEKVVGFPVVESPFPPPDSLSRAIYINGTDGKFICPRYSTDIAAAWDVVEKIKDHFKFEIHTLEAGWFVCHVKSIDESIPVQHSAQGQSAAKVICLAALKAVGVDV